MSADRADSTEVLVIGGGVIGAATAWALARDHVEVALIESGALTKAAGSSRGTARIVAPAPYPDEEYLERAVRAMAHWRQLERDAGVRLLELSGVLYEGRGIEAFVEAWARAGTEIRRLSPAEVKSSYGIAGIEADPVLLQPEGGVILADRAREALLHAAGASGARLCEDERTLEIAPESDQCKVRTARRTWSCSQAVLVAGPWTKGVAAELGIELPLAVNSQSVAYFDPPPDLEAMPPLVAFDGDEPYSLIDPARGLKAALHRSGPEVAPDRWDVVDHEALESVTAWARARFPGLDPGSLRTESCLYTNTADERFMVERRDTLLIASTCSGQGFQFAPDTGAWLAELARDRSPAT